MDQPNILLIVADQHRWDCLGAMGNREIHTSNLDALARDGILFQNCFTTFPVCTPARYSLLTGLYAHQHHGIYNRSTLAPELTTFPQILKNSGYGTKCIGKMHFTPTYADVGFEEMILAEQDGPGRYDDDYHRDLMQKRLVDAVDMRDQIRSFRKVAPQSYRANFGSDPTNLPDDAYSTAWIGNQVCHALENWTTSGNLLMVGFIKPHHPFDVSNTWGSRYDPTKLTLLPGWIDDCLVRDFKYHHGYFDHSTLSSKNLQQIMAQYYGSITQIDFYVGEMIKTLKEKGLYDQTLIIYTSDHGEFLGFHHLLLKGNYMYDPLMRIPLIVKLPQNQFRGTFQDNLVSIIDIPYSILKITNCIIPDKLEKQCHLLINPNRTVVYGETDRGDYFIRSSTQKLLWSSSKTPQFYDFEKDLYELENKIEDSFYQSQISQLKELLFKWVSHSKMKQKGIGFFLTQITWLVKRHRSSIIGSNIPKCRIFSHFLTKIYFHRKAHDWMKK